VIITIGLKKKAHEMEREHCQIEHRKSKSCPTARQIKFDSVRHLPTPETENQEPKIPFLATRLNSGIFRIFELSELNLNLNGSDCRASKIICNDT